MARNASHSINQSNNLVIIKLIYMSIIFVIVLCLILTFIRPYTIDMGGYVAWSNYLADYGPSQLYGSSGFHIVYAPFYQYFLWFTGEISKLLSLSYLNQCYLIKLWSVLFDFLGAFLIYKIALKKNLIKQGLMACLFYAINPGVFINSSIWGQFDSIPATMLLGVIYLFEMKRHNLAALLFLISVLTKPQSGLLLPVVLFLYFRDFKFDLKSFTRLLSGLLSGMFLYLGIVLPFYIPTSIANEIPGFIDPFYWLFDLYFRSVKDYPFGTANAFNIWTLLGGQIQKDSLPFMSLTYLWWGNVLFGISLMYAFFCLMKGKISIHSIAYFSFLVQFSAFFFLTKMHERYLLPSIIFITLCVVFDKRHVPTCILLSICVFFNHLYLYIISFKEQYWLDRFDPIALFFAALTLLTYIYAIFMGYKIFINNAQSDKCEQS